MAADQFCLRWNNFQVNITSALERLKSDEDLVDVTLTCEGQNVKAHKVILAACSPYFHYVFKENPCQHPVVILKDVKYEDVTALLNFMYHGEVYITQDRLAPFLHTAELLQVKGLTGAGNPLKDFQVHSPAAQPPPPPQPQVKAKKSCAPPPSAPLRRETPPSAVRAARSPLVSPPPKENAKEPDGDPLAKSAHPGVKPGQLLPTHVFPSNDQAGTLYSALHPEQTTTLAPPVSPTTFQMFSSNACSQLSPRISSVSGQSVTQPSSPCPTKRRKTLPRRFSSGNVSSVQLESPFNKGETVKDPLQDSSESTEAESAFKDVDVKVEEPSGDEMLSEGEEGTAACSQELLPDAEGLEFAKQQDDGSADRLMEQDVEAPGAVLLSPPAGKLPRDGAENSYGYGDEPNPLLPWAETTPGSNDFHFLRENVEVQRINPENSRFSETENFNISHAGNVNISPSSLVLQQSAVFVNNISNKNEELRNIQPWQQKRRMLYQKRKHSWYSRRPVSCPNCNKTITMAYNLKSHLNSCVKRFGVVKNTGNV